MMMQTQSALSMFESGRFDNVHGDEDWLEEERKEGAMLILARRKGQRIMINEDIEIVIHDIDETKDPIQIKVGIQAPMNYVIDREEIYLKKKKERNNGNR
jgi:carbon storage regulator CsrA